MKIAVAGGTGVVGRHVVQAAKAAGHEPVVLSRTAGVDLLDENKVAAALSGADVVIDVANAPTLSEKKATAFFTEVDERLSRLGAQAGASRFLVLSIVGIDRVSWTYYRAKVAQEQVARNGPLPATIVRATQFHEFPEQVLDRAHLGPLAVVPVMAIQPIAAAERGRVPRSVGRTAAVIRAHRDRRPATGGTRGPGPSHGPLQRPSHGGGAVPRSGGTRPGHAPR